MARTDALPGLIIEQYFVPDEDLAPEDYNPEPEDCGAGLSDGSLLHWPNVPQR